MARDYIIRRMADIDENVNGEGLRLILDYSPETGEFRWKERSANKFKSGGRGQEFSARAWNARYAGELAGKVNNVNGYRYIRIYGRNYYAHRLAWLWVNGVWPHAEIDHINGNRTDNRIINLRDVDATTNRRNQALSSRNTSGIIGVNFMVARGKWRAEIKIGRHSRHLGLFATKEEAVAARKQANETFGFHRNHGRAA